MDEEGFIDGTFNTHFLKLSGSEKEKNLNIAKTVPYSNTNVNLKNYRLDLGARRPGGVIQLLEALRQCELKNDALLYSFYEYIGEKYQPGYPYAIYLFFGNYDVPTKGKDKENQWESEEVYQFLIGTIGPVTGDYEVGRPEAGFLYPAFADRSTDDAHVAIFQADPEHKIPVFEELFLTR